MYGKQLTTENHHTLVVDYDTYHWARDIAWTLQDTYVLGICSSEGGMPLGLDLKRAIMLALPHDRVELIDPDQPHNLMRANLRLVEPKRWLEAWRSHPSIGCLIGVKWKPLRATYAAEITFGKKRYLLGHFECPRTAALYYDAAARLLNGTQTDLNFPWIPALPARDASASIALVRAALKA